MFYFFHVFLLKATAHVDTKALSIRHQSQKCFRGTLILIPQYQKWYHIYVTSARKIVSSHDVVFDENNILHEHTRHVRIQSH